MDKKMCVSGVDRRDFLKAAASGAAIAGTCPSILAAAETATTQPTKPMALSMLGRTKFAVGRVSFGGGGLKPPSGIPLLKAAIDAGVNLVHTSLYYGKGNSVAAIGAFFKQYPEYRKKVFLCLKNSDPGIDAKKLAEFESTLVKLNVDHVDMFMPTLQDSDPERLDKIVAMCELLANQGKIKFKAFTCHGQLNEVIELVLDKAPNVFDGTLMSMAPVNASGTSQHKHASEEVQKRFLANIAKLREQGVGIISMKSGAGKAIGRGQKMFEPHCKQVINAGADTILTSLKNFNHIETLGQLDLSRLAMTPREQAIATALRNDHCMMCGQCTGACPAGLPVGELMRVSHYTADDADYAADEFRELGVTADQLASECVGCQSCNAACPMGLAAAETIRSVVTRLA